MVRFGVFFDGSYDLDCFFFEFGSFFCGLTEVFVDCWEVLGDYFSDVW